MGGPTRRKELAADLRAFFAASDRRSALGLGSSVAEKWRKKGNEKVAEHLEEHRREERDAEEVVLMERLRKNRTWTKLEKPRDLTVLGG